MPLLPSAPALLAGNSVHADRAFINKDLPLLASKLHYRILDVSSIKELARRWYPKALAESRLKRKEDAEHRYAPILRFTRKSSISHIDSSASAPLRALADIQASIEGMYWSHEPCTAETDDVDTETELKFYREHLFKPVESK